MAAAGGALRGEPSVGAFAVDVVPVTLSMQQRAFPMTASTNAPASDQMVFPAAISPIGAFFVAVPAAIILTAAFVLVTHELSLIVIAVLPIVMVSCAMLIKQAVTDMCEVTVEWSSQGLTVGRITGGTAFVWTEVEKIEAHDPGVGFGDAAGGDGRASLGLYIRNPERKEREHGEPPDLIVLSRAGVEAEKIPKLVDRLSTAKRGAGGKQGRRFGAPPPAVGKPAKGAKSTKGAGGKSFRRTAHG